MTAIIVMVHEGVVYVSPPDDPQGWRRAEGPTLDPAGPITSHQAAWGAVISDGINRIFYDPDTNTTIALKPTKAP